MPSDAGLIVLGGGCAGLSLASHLCGYGKNIPRTLVLEQRAAYHNDRTWCFWGDDQTPFAKLSAHQWDRVSVTYGHKRTLVDCVKTPYRMLSSDTFYAYARERIAQNSLLSLVLSVGVLSDPVYQNGLWHIETTQGKLSAPMVVDTRPPPLAEAPKALLWQSFYGYEIESSTACFDPFCADLMDFSPSNSDNISFTYTLPISKTRALVEYTVFSVLPLAAVELEALLVQQVTSRTQGSPYKIIRPEYGLLPMGITSRRKMLPDHPSYIFAGLTAGAGRPSTGYAFQRIQNWAQRCGAAIATGLPLAAHKQDDYLLRQMDRIFLNVLLHHPRKGPELFFQLFSESKSDGVIRFLSDQASLRDYFAMARSLPALPFIRHIFSGRALQ
jgi:lycopene beta-cyclase